MVGADNHRGPWPRSRRRCERVDRLQTVATLPAGGELEKSRTALRLHVACWDCGSRRRRIAGSRARPTGDAEAVAGGQVANAVKEPVRSF